MMGSSHKVVQRYIQGASLGMSFLCGSMIQATQVERTWTNLEGKKIRAALVEVKSGKASLRLPDGSAAVVNVLQLSEADQLFLRSAQFSQVPNSTVAWPKTVEVSTRTIDAKLQSESPVHQKYVYRSEFFEFTSQDKLSLGLLRDIARTFELTRALVTQLPWHIVPTPPQEFGFYQAKFYLNRENYERDGAPPNSAGLYSMEDRTFKVPFETLGLTLRGKVWARDDHFDTGTIVHEVTHQMMHDVIPFLPPWLIEGTAEYAEMLPRNAGKIFGASHEKGIRDYLKKSQNLGIKRSSILKPSELMKFTLQDWSARSDISAHEQHRRYVSACLLVYYFNHLDASQGKNFGKFMAKIHEAQMAWLKFFNHKDVKQVAQGSYEYPSTLKLPPYERNESTSFAAYPLLLGKTSLEQLDRDFDAALIKLNF